MSIVESGVREEVISIRYKTNTGQPKISATDELMAFEILKNDDFLLSSQIRGSEDTGILVVEYPKQNTEDENYLYLFERRADGKMSSDSVLVS